MEEYKVHKSTTTTNNNARWCVLDFHPSFLPVFQVMPAVGQQLFRRTDSYLMSPDHHPTQCIAAIGCAARFEGEGNSCMAFKYDSTSGMCSTSTSMSLTECAELNQTTSTYIVHNGSDGNELEETASNCSTAHGRSC